MKKGRCMRPFLSSADQKRELLARQDSAFQTIKTLNH
jgi:hypothetical protein